MGGIAGLGVGAAGVLLAQRRYATIRNLTMPMKGFLVTSSATFVGIIAADHASRQFDIEHNPEKQWYETREERLRAEELRGLTFTDRALAFARREKYKIVGATWVASMIGSFVLVGRNPYLSGQQKIVQARVYAQGLTLGVLCASAAFEISDQRRGRGILDTKKEKAKRQQEAAEPAPVHHGNRDEGDLWKDMVAAEEERLKAKHQSLHYKHGEEGQGQGQGEEKEKEQSSESDSEDKSQEQSQSQGGSKPEKPEGKKQA